MQSQQLDFVPQRDLGLESKFKNKFSTLGYVNPHMQNFPSVPATELWIPEEIGSDKQPGQDLRGRRDIASCCINE